MTRLGNRRHILWYYLATESPPILTLKLWSEGSSQRLKSVKVKLRHSLANGQALRHS